MPGAVEDRLAQDSEAERSLLATICAPGAEHIASTLLPSIKRDYFVTPQHRVLFEALEAIIEDESPEVTSITLRDQLVLMGKADLVGGIVGIGEILSADEVARPEVLVDILRRHWTTRRLAEIGHRLMHSPEAAENPNALASEVATTLTNIQMTRADLDESPAGDSIMERLASMSRFANDESSGKLAFFGIERADQRIIISSQDYTIIAARPGCGKTALAVQMMCSSAAKGVKSLFVSLELSKVEAEARIAAWWTRIGYGYLWAGKYETDTASRFNRIRESANNIYVWSRPSGTEWSEVEAKIRRAVAHNGVRLVFIDYFTLIAKPRGNSSASDASLWGELSSKIRRLGQMLNISIVLLCQLNRDGDGSKPRLRDLKETGQLEQDAQIVIGLWKGKSEKSGELEVPYGKNGETQRVESGEAVPFMALLKYRNGDTNLDMQLQFDGPTNRFAEAVCVSRYE